MLGKLLKHEFRATARIMWVLYAAMLALSVGGHFSLRCMGTDTNIVLQTLSVLVTIAWVLALIFGAVMTLVLMVQRFHKNLLTDEGYLMFTLPVSIHSLIFSKIIVSIVWTVVTVVVVCLGIGVATLDSQFLQEIREAVQFNLEYSGEVMKLTLRGAGMLGEVALLGIVGVAVSMLHFYAAMSLGYGFTGHKGLWSVVWYFLISFAVQLVTMVLMMIGVNGGLANALNLDIGWHLTMLAGLLTNLAFGAVLYIVTWLNLKKRLNLA